METQNNNNNLTFLEMGEVYTKFKELVEQKCNDYCLIHNCFNPYEGRNINIQIRLDFIDISCEYYRFGDYDNRTLSIPISFFETKDYSEETQKAQENSNHLKTLIQQLEQLKNERNTITKEQSLLKQDMENFNRLNQLYNISKNEEFEKVYRQYNDFRPQIKTIENKIKTIEKEIFDLKWCANVY